MFFFNFGFGWVFFKMAHKGNLVDDVKRDVIHGNVNVCDSQYFNKKNK